MGGDRRATHADYWYTGKRCHRLGQELSGWLAAVEPTEEQEFEPPITGCRAIIGPKRVFILGPSHHVYLVRCDVSGFDYYETPLGKLRIDKEVSDEPMTQATDEDEHSIEMHLPYICHVFQDLAQTSRQLSFRGARFRYTFYYPEPLPSDVAGVHLKSSCLQQYNLSQRPIYASVSDLDHEAMEILTIRPTPEGEAPAAQSHRKFSDYLDRTGNTICGRHPIGVEWVRYEQSLQCQNLRDSSVSYASAYVSFS
ncbi:memo-like protein-domain-containing protein [Pisolithus microcarpus]|nr:memo-like protein-domain-containing protein [Pisolithus microcarpus]